MKQPSKFKKIKWKQRVSSFICVDALYKPRSVLPVTVGPVLAPTTCHSCGAHERYITVTIECRVCSLCGIVQSECQLVVNPYCATSSIVKKHIYSRSVYFRDLTRGLRGERQSEISKENWKRLKTSTAHLTPFTWKHKGLDLLVPILKTLKLSRYKHSRLWIAHRLSKGQCKPVTILKHHLDRILRMFTAVESVYKEVVKFAAPKRKIFMNYAYLFACLCNLCNVPHYTSDIQLPQNRESVNTQARLWRALCVRLHWRWNALTY